MSYERIDYYIEAVDAAAEDAGVTLTSEQTKTMAHTIEGAVDNIGMAFYQPPSSDRINVIEREWKTKYEDLQRRFDSYCDDAETAIKKALRQHSDVRVTIGKYGEVLRHGGRTEQIQ